MATANEVDSTKRIGSQKYSLSLDKLADGKNFYITSHNTIKEMISHMSIYNEHAAEFRDQLLELGPGKVARFAVGRIHLPDLTQPVTDLLLDFGASTETMDPITWSFSNPRYSGHTTKVAIGYGCHKPTTKPLILALDDDDKSRFKNSRKVLLAYGSKALPYLNYPRDKGSRLHSRIAEVKHTIEKQVK